MVFGAFRDTRIVGTAGFAIRPGEKENHKGLLWGMYVRPEARGAGVAGRLVEAVIDLAQPRVELLQLSVVVGNERARAALCQSRFRRIWHRAPLSEARWAVFRRDPYGPGTCHSALRGTAEASAAFFAVGVSNLMR